MIWNEIKKLTIFSPVIIQVWQLWIRFIVSLAISSCVIVCFAISILHYLTRYLELLRRVYVVPHVNTISYIHSFHTILIMKYDIHWSLQFLVKHFLVKSFDKQYTYLMRQIVKYLYVLCVHYNHNVQCKDSLIFLDFVSRHQTKILTMFRLVISSPENITLTLFILLFIGISTIFWFIISLCSFDKNILRGLLCPYVLDTHHVFLRSPFSCSPLLRERRIPRCHRLGQSHFLVC